MNQEMFMHMVSTDTSFCLWAFSDYRKYVCRILIDRIQINNKHCDHLNYKMLSILVLNFQSKI